MNLLISLGGRLKYSLKAVGCHGDHDAEHF